MGKEAPALAAKPEELEWFEEYLLGYYYLEQSFATGTFFTELQAYTKVYPVGDVEFFARVLRSLRSIKLGVQNGHSTGSRN